MKLRIEKSFTDKITGEKYKVGTIVVFAENRAKELLADKRNLVSEVQEPDQVSVAEPNQIAPVEKPKAKRIKK